MRHSSLTTGVSWRNKNLNANVLHSNPEYECDVNLSKVHKNIINVPTFHSGESLEISFTLFFCVYIKRDVLDSSVCLDAERDAIIFMIGYFVIIYATQ